MMMIIIMVNTTRTVMIDDDNNDNDNGEGVQSKDSNHQDSLHSLHLSAVAPTRPTVVEEENEHKL